MEESRLRDQEWDYERFWDGGGETARSRIETLDVVVHASDNDMYGKSVTDRKSKSDTNQVLLLSAALPWRASI